MDLYVDIETAPSQRPDVRERMVSAALEAAESEPVPSSIANLKTEELRIARSNDWRESKIAGAESEADEEWRRTALEGGYGEIICASWAFNDGEVKTLARESMQPERETELLHQFWLAMVEGSKGKAVKWIGHNVGFDLRFLHHRCVVRQIRPTIHIPYNDAPWRGSYLDTMHAWVGARGGVKLTVLCDMLGIEVHDEIDGSQVWGAYQAGRLDQIVAHCEADVRRVREIAKRLRWEA